MNIGEEIVAAYLSSVKRCEFTQLNLHNPDVQGEIDVIGINLINRKIYVCEVAIHLETGLQYTKEKKPITAVKLTEKFSKDIEYSKKYFADYNQHFMFWSPLVKPGKNAKYSQMRDIDAIDRNIKQKYDVNIDFVINERFLESMNEMREFAKRQTKDLKSPVLRLFQLEEKLKKHFG